MTKQCTLEKLVVGNCIDLNTKEQRYTVCCELGAIADIYNIGDPLATAHLFAAAPNLLNFLEGSLDTLECAYLDLKSTFTDLEQRTGGEAYETEIWEQMEDAKEIWENAKAAIEGAKS